MSEFQTTHWSQVLAARSGSSDEAREALRELCRTYWYPLYVFVRRQGYSAEESRDLTQAYFTTLLEKEYLKDLDPEIGRFRAFLKISVKHFLSKERDKTAAWKRGGRTAILDLDALEAENRYRFEPASQNTPEDVFERRWALMLLEQAMIRLEREFDDAGRSGEFQRLRGYLTGAEPRVPYKQVASELGSSEGAVKASVHRLRRRFGEFLRQAVAETVARPEDVDGEVKYLLGVIEPWEPERP